METQNTWMPVPILSTLSTSTTLKIESSYLLAAIHCGSRGRPLNLEDMMKVNGLILYIALADSAVRAPPAGLYLVSFFPPP